MALTLVTGGAGFIGSHLVPALAGDGHAVRVLDTLSPQVHGDLPAGLGWLAGRPGVEVHRGSVTEEADLRRALDGATRVVHLAAETGTGQSMYEIERYARTNVAGTALLMHLLANERGLGVERVVLASSRSVYGEGAYEAPDGARLTPPPRSAEALRAAAWEPVRPTDGAPLRAVPTREDDPTAPASIYAATKLAQEDLVRIGCASLGIGWAILRLQNVYGEGQSLQNPYTGLLSILSTRIRRGLDLPIYEDGRATRDFVHVSDVVAAMRAALAAPRAPDSTLNVGSGEGTTIREAAQALSRAMGAPDRAHVTGQYRLGDIRHNRADIGRLAAVLGVAPVVDLPSGLARLAAWVAGEPLPADRLDEATSELARRRMMG